MNGNIVKIIAILLVIAGLVFFWQNSKKNKSTAVTGRPSTTVITAKPATAAAPSAAISAPQAVTPAPQGKTGVAQGTSKAASTIPYKMEPAANGGVKYSFPVNRGYDGRIEAMRKRWGEGQPSVDNLQQAWISFNLSRSQASREKIDPSK